MVHKLNRNVQSINIFLSSWAIVLLVVGLVMEEWVELAPKIKKDNISHSPWMECCTAVWPEDSLKTVRATMLSVLSLSVSLNLIIGLQFTHMIPQNKYIHFIIAFLCFLTGFLLFFALFLYHHKLKQGQSVYFSSFKITWVAFTAYLTTGFFFTCGVLSLIQSKLFISACSCWKIAKSGKECKDGELSETSFVSFPERTAMPRRSIISAHRANAEEDALSKTKVQTRRVTWAE